MELYRFPFAQIKKVTSQMPFPRLTWAGLLVATLGWGFLLAFPLLAPQEATGAASGDIHDPGRFIVIFGENAVMTGFALALLGALERVLTLLGRNVSMAPAPSRPGHRQNNNQVSMPNQGHSAHAPTAPFLSQRFANELLAHRSSNGGSSPRMSDDGPPPRAPNDVITRGALNGRDYVLFRDGSVVVETLLGPRRFPSIAEAQEFIGAN